MVTFTSASRYPKRPDDASDHRHRQLIGYIGLVLPIVLIAIALWRDGLEQWRNLESVSAYYYTGANAAFVGMLVALALFLFTYEGYKNEHQWLDRWCAVLSALAALGVAFFPTAAPAGYAALNWWEPWVGVVHHVSAIILFLAFAVFSFWLFTEKAKEDKDSAKAKSEKDRGKEARNAIYYFCGVMIVICIAWAAYQGMKGASIFWPESVALIFFAISWLVKGRALRSISDAARSLLSPGDAANDQELSSGGRS